MAGRILVPDLRAFDQNGDPISGASLYTYVTGTTTNLAAYTDESLTTPLSNPIVADAAGRFVDIWVASDVPYRIVVKDASGNVVNDTDPVYAQGAGVLPAPLSKSSAYTATSDDQNRDIYCTGTWALTLPLGDSLTPGFKLRVINEGTGVITLTAQGGDLINGGATYTLLAAAIVDIDWNGTTWKTANVGPSQGRQAIWIPAPAMAPQTTNGATFTASELSTNKQIIRAFEFDKDTAQYAQFSWRMPKAWDRSTLAAVFAWSHPSTSTNFGVVWGIQAVATGDGDALDAAWGTAQTVTDTGGATDTLYIAPETSAMTVSGSPASEDLVMFRVYRDATNAADTLAVNAKFLGVTLYINTNAQTDA